MKSFKMFMQEKVHADDKYTKKALEFFLKKFGVDTNTTTVVLKELATMKGPDGLTQPAAKDKFVIFLKKDHPRADRLRVIAHECAHVAQMVTGKIIPKKDANGDIKLYWNNELIDPDKVPYRRRPWEIEAYTLEKRYLHDFIEIHGNDFSEATMKIDIDNILALENILKNAEKLESSDIMWRSEKYTTPSISIMSESSINVEKTFNKSVGYISGIFVPKSKHVVTESGINTESWWFLNPQEILKYNKSRYKTITTINELKTYKDVVSLLNDVIKWNNYLNERCKDNS